LSVKVSSIFCVHSKELIRFNGFLMLILLLRLLQSGSIEQILTLWKWLRKLFFIIPFLLIISSSVQILIFVVLYPSHTAGIKLIFFRHSLSLYCESPCLILVKITTTYEGSGFTIYSLTNTMINDL
jgi:hypothetical protein